MSGGFVGVREANVSLSVSKCLFIRAPPGLQASGDSRQLQQLPGYDTFEQLRVAAQSLYSDSMWLLQSLRLRIEGGQPSATQSRCFYQVPD